MNKIFLFPKKNRLCTQKTIAKLSSIKNGNSKLIYPLLLKWDVLVLKDTEPNFKIVFSVPKRKFKKAVDRNRIKRLLKESFRTQLLTLKQIITDEQVSISFLCLYLDDKEPTFSDLQKKWKKFFKHLRESFSLKASDKGSEV